MCGIGLIWFKNCVLRIEIQYGIKIMKRMLEATEMRGNDAFGITRIRGDNIKTWKFTNTYSDVDIDEVFNDVKQGDVYIWNNRAKPMTEVESTDENSVQPIIFNELILTHNGVVANEKECQDTFNFTKQTKIDSEYFAHAYIYFNRNTKIAAEFIIGGSAYIMFDSKTKEIILVKDFKPLAYASNNNLFCAMSDVDEFRKIFGTDFFIDTGTFYKELAEFSITTINVETHSFFLQSFEPRYISSLPKKDNNKALVMASGGVDSSTAAAIAKKLYGMDVILVHFNFGQKSEEQELRAAKYLSEFLQCRLLIINLGWLGSLGESVLTDPNLSVPQSNDRENLKSTVCWTPARNLVFSAVLMAIAESIGAGKIYNGWTLEEEGSYPDNSIGFFRAMNKAADYGTLTRPRVEMIEANLMKPEIITLGRNLGLNFSKLWSCDDGGVVECGKCGACWLKCKAIEIANNKHYDINKIKNKLRK